MIESKVLCDLYRHMEWADAAVWATVLASAEACEDTKLREYLHHLHVVQVAFLRTWRGEPRETPYPQFVDARSLMLWARTFYGQALGYLEELPGARLQEPLVVPWAPLVERQLGRAPAATTIADTALQIVFHSHYHRGQINARLRSVGGEPPLVDYIAWVWLERPAAVWPSATGAQ